MCNFDKPTGFRETKTETNGKTGLRSTDLDTENPCLQYMQWLQFSFFYDSYQAYSHHQTNVLDFII